MPEPDVYDVTATSITIPSARTSMIESVVIAVLTCVPSPTAPLMYNCV